MMLAHWSGLHRFLTLTAVGDDWQTIRARIKRFVYDVRQERGHVDVVWCVEPNPANTGNHIHALTGGQWVDQRDWSSLADRRGLGEVVWIEDTLGWTAAAYASKAGLYSVKGAGGGPEAYGEWLELAGGRGVHWTRRAFGGLTVAEARAAWNEEKARGRLDPGPWVREPIADGKAQEYVRCPVTWRDVAGFLETPGDER